MVKKLCMLAIGFSFLAIPAIKGNAMQSASAESAQIRSAFEQNSDEWYFDRIAGAKQDINQQRDFAHEVLMSAADEIMEARKTALVYGGGDMALIQESMTLLQEALRQLVPMDKYLATLDMITKHIAEFSKSERGEIAIWLTSATGNSAMITNEVIKISTEAVDKAHKAISGLKLPQKTVYQNS